MSETKICTKCGIEKDLDEFYLSIKRGKPTYSTQCKACELAYHRERRQGSEGDKIRERDRKKREQNKDEINAKNRERYADDPERYRGYKLKWRNTHYDDYLRQAKELRLKNKDRIKAYKKKYDQENKDKKKKWDKKYRSTHHEQRNEYSRIRKERDPLFRLKHQIGTLVLNSLKKGGYKKKTKTATILGCDYATFFDHLKATWAKNYGKEWNGEPYHIDHVIPLATAKTEQDVIDLCHYTNLQMLKPEDNMDKKDKLDWSLDNNQNEVSEND